MSLVEQMLWVDRLMRRPAGLGELDELDPADAAVLATIDPARLEAVSRTFAGLIVARWWQPRFPAVLATLERFAGSKRAAARLLVSHPAFESAQGEDEDGAALVRAVLDALAEGTLEAPVWLPELLAYEYLLSTGLPRRARGEPLAEGLEERVLACLPRAAWLRGGRLPREVLVLSSAWPIGALQEEPHDAEPDPQALLLATADEDVLELELSDEGVDALELLAAGAADAVLREALGEEVEEFLATLRELSLLAREP